MYGITRIALYRTQGLRFDHFLVSGENYGKKSGMKIILSLAGETEGDIIFREEKIQKRKKSFRECPMTEGHLSEGSFLDLRGHFSILIQMREIGTKQIF